MTSSASDAPLQKELPAVAALRALSVFTADQAGAYREHFAALAAALGEDVQTKLGLFLTQWATAGDPGTVVLTGNAGTGKTAAAEAYCGAAGGVLPAEDALVEIAPGRRVLKDLSGLPAPARAATMRDALGPGRRADPRVRQRGSAARRGRRAAGLGRRCDPGCGAAAGSRAGRDADRCQRQPAAARPGNSCGQRWSTT